MIAAELTPGWLGEVLRPVLGDATVTGVDVTRVAVRTRVRRRLRGAGCGGRPLGALAGHHEALGIPDYGWERCWTDYRAQSVHGLVLVLLASPGVERTERGDRMFLTMARRVAAQIADLDAFAARPARR